MTNDIKLDNNYNLEWACKGTGQNGKSYEVIWHFDKIKGREPEEAPEKGNSYNSKWVCKSIGLNRISYEAFWPFD